MANLNIGGRLVGDGCKPLVIAEMGINHGGSLTEAFKIAEAAINAGAEVIKHQTHIIADEMSTDAQHIIPDNANINIYEIMDNCALSESDEKKLMDFITSKGAIFISTPFSRAAVDRLVKFNVPAFKIGSGECNNYPLIKYIAKFRKPVILSTGMNSLQSVAKAVSILESANCDYALLHCTNVYPTPHNLVRLGAMSELKENFPKAVIGLSDHTVDNYACLGAVALGASILERHFTDNPNRQGPDISCSMHPESLKDLIYGANMIFLASGGRKEIVPEEVSTANFAFASVVSIKDIYPGEPLTEDNIWIKRPGTGEFNANDF